MTLMSSRVKGIVIAPAPGSVRLPRPFPSRGGFGPSSRRAAPSALVGRPADRQRALIRGRPLDDLPPYHGPAEAGVGRRRQLPAALPEPRCEIVAEHVPGQELEVQLRVVDRAEGMLALEPEQAVQIG